MFFWVSLLLKCRYSPLLTYSPSLATLLSFPILSWPCCLETGFKFTSIFNFPFKILIYSKLTSTPVNFTENVVNSSITIEMPDKELSPALFSLKVSTALVFILRNVSYKCSSTINITLLYCRNVQLHIVKKKKEKCAYSQYWH